MRSWITSVLYRSSLIVASLFPAVMAAQLPHHPRPFEVGPDSTNPIVQISPASLNSPTATLAVAIAFSDVCGFFSNPVIILNGTNITSQFTFTPHGTNGPQCTGYSQNAQGTIALNAGANTLIASVVNLNHRSGADTATYINSTAIHRLRVWVAAGAMHAAPNTKASVAFTVTNLGNTTDTVYTKNHCYGYGLVPDCYTIPDSSVGLVPGGVYSGTAYVYTSDSVGQVGRLETIAYERSHAGVTDTGYTDITVQNPLSAGVVLNTVTPDVTWPRNKCLTIEIQPGVAYQCGDLRVVHELPTTRTYNKTRTPALIYNSNLAVGVYAIGALVTFNPSMGTPDTVHAVITDSASGKSLGSNTWLGKYWVNGATQRVTVRADEIGNESNARWAYTFTATAVYNAAKTTQSYTATGAQISTQQASANGFEQMLAGQEMLVIPQWLGATPWNSTKPLYWQNSEGDTRQYNPVPGDSLVWASVGVDRPDTIKMFQTDSLYGAYRYAEHGAVVHFDPHGGINSELEVIDRLGHHTRLVDTAITGVANPLSVDIPSPNGGLPYVFMHSWGGRLDSVVAPSVSGQSRTVHFRYDTLNLYADTIKDPDGSVEVYRFLNGQPHLPGYDLMTSYQNKHGTITRFYYDSAYKLVKAIIDSGPEIAISPNVPSLNITWTFQPAESQGYTTPVSPDSAYTLVTGPRGNQSCTFPLQPCPDSADVTRFWVDQWGEPTRIRDAHGDEIELTRGNPTYPSLVTYARYQNGRVEVERYDRRGNDSTLTDSSFAISGQYAITNYTFDGTYDFVTKIARPAGDSIMFYYDPATGNRLWQQPGQLALRRVTFTYFPSDSAASGLLQSIQMPADTSPITVSYDHKLVNDSGTVTALGIYSYVTRDAIGRVTGVHSPIDGTNWRTDSTAYDAMDRAAFTSSHAPALTHDFSADATKLGGFAPPNQPFTADSEAVTVTTTYDSTGNPKTIIRQAFPDSGGVGQMRTDLVYDAGNRLIQKTQHYGTPDSTATDYSFPDAAGNIIASITRRQDTIRVTYDALNRIVQRRLPAKEYPRDTASQFAGWGMTMPQYSNCADGTGYCIPADTATFAYDHAGNMTVANNGDAQITRAYLQNGDLAADTLRIRTVANADFTQHVYGLTYTYDLDGRRLTMNHPTNLAPQINGVTFGQSTFTYDQQGIGELTDVTDVLDNDFTYEYDADGRVFHLGSAAGTAQQHWTYDRDSRLVERIDSTPNVSPVNGWQYNTLHDDSMFYDLRGKVVEADLNAPFEATVVLNAYSGLGALVDNLIKPLNSVEFSFTYNEDFSRPDAFGNVLGRWHDALPAASDSASSFLLSVFQLGSGRLLQTVSLHSGFTYFANSDADSYDLSGNLIRTISQRYMSAANHIAIGTDQYYDAAQQLRAVDKHLCYFGGNNSCQYALQSISDIPSMQQYRYDALGRRVLVASVVPPACAGFPRDDFHAYCFGFIERTVYDGNQVLYEIRMPDSVGVASSVIERDTGGVVTYEGSDAQYGRVVYAHGLQLDDPLDIIRVGFDTLYAGPQQIVPLQDWRGGYDAGTFAGGARYECSETPDSVTFVDSATTDLCMSVIWTDTQYGPYREDLFLASQEGLVFPLWHGSLIASRRDLTNQIYLRNRYYDPQTGRFTQEDPLGLAGGLNAYGFAAGDPVNYSDPFGLCSQADHWSNCSPGSGAGSAAVFNQLAAKKGQINTGVAEFAALGAVGGAAFSGIVGGGASAGFIKLSGGVGGATLLPVVASAVSKLEELADKFGTTASAIANQALTTGTKLIDNLEANAGNINNIIPRLDGASGFIRVTTDPTQSRIISAGIQSANQVTNGIATGRFTPMP